MDRLEIDTSVAKHHLRALIGESESQLAKEVEFTTHATGALGQAFVREEQQLLEILSDLHSQTCASLENVAYIGTQALKQVEAVEEADRENAAQLRGGH
ncbi:MAG: hypothetical protein Q3976_07155 [Corynebacterium sp.]|nr:hypothetical protein [Corynebacterium sp.]